MKYAFGTMTNEKTLKKILVEADVDKDGEISFEEFWGMMTKFKENRMSTMMALQKRSTT